MGMIKTGHPPIEMAPEPPWWRYVGVDKVFSWDATNLTLGVCPCGRHPCAVAFLQPPHLLIILFVHAIGLANVGFGRHRG